VLCVGTGNIGPITSEEEKKNKKDKPQVRNICYTGRVFVTCLKCKHYVIYLQASRNVHINTKIIILCTGPYEVTIVVLMLLSLTTVGTLRTKEWWRMRDQMCGLRDHPISHLPTSTCGAIFYAKRRVTRGASSGMQLKRLGQHATCLTSFSSPGTGLSYALPRNCGLFQHLL
jgi:hypothetical protein